MVPPDTSNTGARPALDRVLRALRQVQLEGTVFGQAVAVRFGLSERDVEAIAALLDAGAESASWLAERLGLTSGAVTRLIDRLEQAGFVRRVADPHDRRRVVVEPVPEKVRAIEAVLERLGRVGSEALQGYTEEQLAVIGDFLARMAEVARSEAASLRSGASRPNGSPVSDERAALLGAVDRGRLILRSGLERLTLASLAERGLLYRARFDGQPPRVAVRGGDISVRFAHGPVGGGGRAAHVELNPTIPWQIEAAGQVESLVGNLADLDVRSVDVAGRAGDVDLELGDPRGEVSVRLRGGVRVLRVRRPASVAVRCRIVGKVGRLSLDGVQVAPRPGVFELTSGQVGDRGVVLVELIGGGTALEIEGR